MNESIAKLTLERAVNEAQARSILNATMLKLRTQYGYAPDKGVTPDEMTARCEALVEAVCGAVEDYVEATGKAPDRMRNTARYRVSKEFPKKKYEGLQAYANVLDQRLKRAPLHTAEAIGNLLDFNAEYLVKAHELDEIKRRSRKEWQRLEYEYVERSDFNLRELHHRLLEHMDEEVFGDSIAGSIVKNVGTGANVGVIAVTITFLWQRNTLWQRSEYGSSSRLTPETRIVDIVPKNAKKLRKRRY